MRKPKNWTKRDAEAFLLYCLRTIGGGYHPDTPMSDYRDMDGNPTFSEGEAKEFQAMHDWALGLIPDEEELYRLLTRAKEAIWPGSTPGQQYMVSYKWGHDPHLQSDEQDIYESLEEARRAYDQEVEDGSETVLSKIIEHNF